jgi:hypothetical protein
VAGEIRLGDRNYGRGPALRRFLAAGDGTADFIARAGWNALRLTSPDSQAFDLIGYLRGLPVDAIPHEVNVRAAAGPADVMVAMRMIVLRKTPEATEAARTALRRAAVKRGRQLDPRSLIAAEFMILVTSLPAEGYKAADILAVYRLRWQACPCEGEGRTRVQTPEIAAPH